MKTDEKAVYEWITFIFSRNIQEHEIVCLRRIVSSTLLYMTTTDMPTSFVLWSELIVHFRVEFMHS
jgi:hypothetical protein